MQQSFDPPGTRRGRARADVRGTERGGGNKTDFLQPPNALFTARQAFPNCN